MLKTRAEKQELKATVINALRGKLPIQYHGCSIEVVASTSAGDPYLLLKVKDPTGYLLTYLKVCVKETY
jgi:hypothetical protein